MFGIRILVRHPPQEIHLNASSPTQETVFTQQASLPGASLSRVCYLRRSARSPHKRYIAEFYF